MTAQKTGKTILMLLTNAYDPDPRVREEALSLLRAGYRVRLLAWDRDRKSIPAEVMEGVEVERVFLASTHGRGTTQLIFYAWLYLTMLWRAWRTRCDAIHCHDLDTLPLGYVLARTKRRPLVYDAHESFPDMLEGNVHPAIIRLLFRLEDLLIRRVDLLITVGEKLRRHFEDRGARHSVVVGNWKRASEYNRTEAENREVRRALDLPEHALAILCITNLFPDRKLEELLEAVEQSDLRVYLVVGGKGALAERIRERAKPGSRIRYLGFVHATDIPRYTCASDVVFYGFDPNNPNARFSAPNKLSEALVAGKPIITGDFGEIAKVVRETGCGIVLPSYAPAHIRDAIRRLADGETRAAMAAAAKRHGASAMNWSHAETTLVGEYARILERHTQHVARVPVEVRAR